MYRLNKNIRGVRQKDKEKGSNPVPRDAQGEGGRECAICSTIVDVSTMVKSKKGNLVCKQCEDR